MAKKGMTKMAISPFIGMHKKHCQFWKGNDWIEWVFWAYSPSELMWPIRRWMNH
jgi:hypothetical protein